MIGRLMAIAAVGTIVNLSASADPADLSNSDGEALAWTVAAYGSCESRSDLQTDFQAEATKLQASNLDIIDALQILATADNVCGEMNTFAADMLELADSDIASFEARLAATKPNAQPVTFQVEEPEGAGPQASIILANSSELPPQSGADAPDSSDYQE